MPALFKTLNLSPPLPQFCKVHVAASPCNFNPTSEFPEVSFIVTFVLPLVPAKVEFPLFDMFNKFVKLPFTKLKSPVVKNLTSSVPEVIPIASVAKFPLLLTNFKNLLCGIVTFPEKVVFCEVSISKAVVSTLEALPVAIVNLSLLEFA